MEKYKEAIDAVTGEILTSSKKEQLQGATQALNELVLKETPKKIKYTDDGLTYCPVCNGTLRRSCDQVAYCSICGQKIQG